MKLKQKKDGLDFIISVNDNDTILIVKNKLSEQIATKSDDLVFVYKNKILDDNMYIKEFKMSPDDFVLFCSKIDYMVSYTVDRIDFIAKSKRLSGQIDKNFLSVYSNVHLLFICLNFNYPSISSSFPVILIVSDVIEYLSKEIHIPNKHIKLFKDKNALSSINTEKDFIEIINSLNIQSNEINIYYQIIPHLDRIIKQTLIETGTWWKMYTCTEIESNRKLTLKSLNILKNPAGKELFDVEIEILSMIKSHPRIVKLERIIEKKNKFYILMENFPGGSLGEFIKINGRLQENKISKYSKQILEALDYLCDKRIIHRNLKGNNIILGEDDNVKLSNFGLAKFIGNISSTNLSDAIVLSNVGDPNWTAPEVVNGDGYGIFVDIWSFGAVVIEMLTGNPPFHNLKMYQILSRLTTEKKVEYNSPKDTSSEIIDFINLCMKPEPSQRHTPKQLLQHDFIKRY